MTACFPLLVRSLPALSSPYVKADLRRRVCAAATDGFIVGASVFFYQRLNSLPLLISGAAYALLRDGMRGQSVGKLLFGLIVVSLETGQPATLPASVRRNFLFLLPGANVAAIFLEAMTLARDVQGQRLGDRIAQTQVVEGFGAKDLAKSLMDWWRGTVELAGAGKGDRTPVPTDR